MKYYSFGLKNHKSDYIGTLMLEATGHAKAVIKARELIPNLDEVWESLEVADQNNEGWIELNIQTLRPVKTGPE